MENNIYIQDGCIIHTLRPSSVAHARIFSEEQRAKIKQLLHYNFFPHHTAVGKGKSTRKHWNLEKYRGKYGVGFKMITTSSISSNFNHLTYFLKMI